MPYVTERWPGGMLTNFVTIRKVDQEDAEHRQDEENGTFETYLSVSVYK